MKNKIRLAVLYAWQPLLLWIFVAFFIVLMLWFQLGSLVPGLSNAEVVTQKQLATGALSLQGIFTDPFYLPYNFTLFVLQEIGAIGTVALRSVSALIGALSLMAFYIILSYWYAPRIAVLGTILFGTSSWFLHTARLGEPAIAHLSILVVIAAALWFQKSSYRKTYLTILSASSVGLLYIPGMIWFLGACFVWQATRIMKEVKKIQSSYYAVLLLTVSTLLIPLVYSFIRNPLYSLQQLLGLPDTVPTLNELSTNFIEVFKSLFVSGPAEPSRWLVGTPILSLFSLIMFAIGILCLVQKFRMERTRAQLAAITAATLLVALGGPVPLAILIPFVYLIIIAGISYMLHEWFAVFPRNPIARTAGTTLITIAVLVTSFYDISRYYIAWPNTPETKASFQQQPITSDTIDQ